MNTIWSIGAEPVIDWLRDEIANPAVEIDGRNVPIVLKRHPRARRLTMRIAPDGAEIHITIPKWGRTRDALDFAQSRQQWLRDQLDGIEEHPPLTNGSILPFRGTPCQIIWRANAPRAVRIADGQISIGGPEDKIAGRLERWLRQEAQPLLEEDLAFFCARIGHKPPLLALSRARRRWGSCSSKGTVRINWRLIMAPDNVRRSVVAHEVAHLVHFDHSREFYTLLGDIFDGDLAAADSWLKSCGKTLYQPFG